VTLPATAEHPPARTLRWWVLDGIVVAAAGASMLPYLFHDRTTPRASMVALAVALTLPLLVRRIWPVTVFGWVALLTVGAAVVLRVPDPGLAVLVALGTVATLRPRRVALIAAGVLEVGVVVAAVRVLGSGWWYGAIFLSGMVAAALGLGLYAATRRAYLAELHDRAERLERERDQQGALAAAAERTHIAREIHDIVAHHLTVIVALSDGAVATSAANPERAADVMRTVSATGRRALADTRRLLGVLREDTEEGVPRQPVPDLAELDGLIERVRAAGLPVSYVVSGHAGDLPAGVQLTVYRLVQEALTNTLKHGGTGASATVALRHSPGELRLDVTDDGAGASAPVPVGVGRGLAGMRERVQAFDGEVHSGPRAPGGWRVSARLRLDEVPAP
jgi:signal transduction histidine kinase